MKITHDFHLHTHLSLCADKSASVELYANNAKKLGLKKLGITDHFWDENVYLPGNFNAKEWYGVQNFAHVSEAKKDIERFSSPDLKIYFGCEAEYNPFTGGVGMSPETAEKFDFIIVAHSHTHITMPEAYLKNPQKHIEYMEQAYFNIINSDISRYITSMAHPFASPDDSLMAQIPTDVFKRVFSKTAEKGIAAEINVNPHFTGNGTKEEIAQRPEFKMYEIAKQCGCKFTFGSDSHGYGEHERFGAADIIAELLALKESDLAEFVR